MHNPAGAIFLNVRGQRRIRLYVYLFTILCLLHCVYRIVYYVHILHRYFMYLAFLLHVYVDCNQIN